ncbi:MAG: GAF domain-containing protein [Chloroflexi bacterium]|nr:MAG: GAF domain-containing protein [Chloroflexota bacterium]
MRHNHTILIYQFGRKPMVIDESLLAYILQISRKMAEMRRLSPVLNYALKEAINLVGAERGYVVLVSDDGSLDFRVKLDSSGQDIEHPEDQISRSILQEVVSTGEPLVLRNAMQNERFGQADSVVVLGLRSIMAVPLISRGDTIGAIYVENRAIRNRFSQDDAVPLVVFANQAAVAIENAALNDELEARVQARTRQLEQATQRLEESWHEAVESNRVRTVWLSQIAHDLRAPLGIASGALSLLNEGVLGSINAEQREWVEKSLQSVLHAATLTEDIFDLSRLEEGQIRLHMEPVNTERFLNGVYELAQGLPWAEGVQLSLEIANSLPWATFDAVRIQQVLFNLLANAQKFTRQGSVVIRAEQQPEPDLIHISVSDTGKGIPPDRIETLFKRFRQVDDSASRHEGAGLGLAICRELVTMHHGKIWVNSEPGTGSTFTFSLPTNLPPTPMVTG